jgi:hypothetical protein
MTDSIEFTGKWDLFIQLGGAKFKQILDDVVRKATEDNCKYLVEQIKRLIHGRAYTANAQSTIDAKGSDIPLIDTGELVNKFTYVLKNPYLAFVGIRAGETHAKWKDVKTILWTLHQGTNKAGKSHNVVIPPRPYIDTPVGTDAIRKVIIKCWEDQLNVAIRKYFGI